jgi:hypothetical protein
MLEFLAMADRLVGGGSPRPLPPRIAPPPHGPAPELLSLLVGQQRPPPVPLRTPKRFPVSPTALEVDDEPEGRILEKALGVVDTGQSAVHRLEQIGKACSVLPCRTPSDRLQRGENYSTSSV